MSTLAAARADNFYYPPEWDPSKGSINKFQGQHPLRERAKKLDQGILVIRFEMPFNVWCEKCGHLIGKGVRFNAEKKAIGNYHTTKIWSFSMTTPCCSNRIEIHTDPKNARYVIVSGARQKVEEYTAEDAEVIELAEASERAALDDPIARLEHGEGDKRRARDARERLQALREDSAIKFQDDYQMNKALRREMRAARKEEKLREVQRRALGLHDSVKLLPHNAEDAQAAALVAFGDSDAFVTARRQRRQEISQASIFSKPAVPAPGAKQHRSRVASSPDRTQTVGPAVVKRSTGEKAALALKRRRIEQGIKLGLSTATGGASRT